MAIARLLHHECPTCGSSKVGRSAQREGDRYAGHLLRSPYRCRKCGARFWSVSNETALRLAAGAFIALVFLGFSLGPTGTSSEPPSGVEQHRAVADGSDDYTLALQFLRGVGQPKDDRQAFAHFQNAARNGHPAAQYQLSRMLAEGHGAKADPDRSLMWLHIAAESGVADAQFELGMAFMEGRGMPRDPVQAYSWLSVAAAQGVAGAPGARDAALAALSPAEVTAAKAHADRLMIRTLQRSD